MAKRRLLLASSVAAYFLTYSLIALEIFIMITPFAAYFYAFFAPILNAVYGSKYTSWMGEFFLPHLVFTGSPFMKFLGAVKPMFLFFGLGLFFYAALPLYWAKFGRKGLLSRGLYRMVRHPQYLGLGIAGLGMLLYWPRFIILILYVTMLFVYYLLARKEEREMLAKHGASYKAYMDSAPMFLPGEIGGRLFKITFGPLRPKALAVSVFYAAAVTALTGAAFLLRDYSARAVPMEFSDGIAVVSVIPEAGAGAVVSAAIKERQIAERLQGSDISVAYVMPTDFFMMGLLTDVERIFPEGFEKPPIKSHIARFLKIFVIYTKLELGVIPELHPQRRILFASVSSRDGLTLRGRDAFSLDSKRYPIFYADVDMENSTVLDVGDCVPRHEWGEIPMPVF